MRFYFDFEVQKEFRCGSCKKYTVRIKPLRQALSGQTKRKKDSPQTPKELASSLSNRLLDWIEETHLCLECERKQ